MPSHGITRNLAPFAIAVSLAAAPAPASAATLAGTEQVWQGSDWAVEATPYWCRAYPVAAEKNADGIPAVALIQWDGKVYLEFARPKNKDAATKVGKVKTKIDSEKTVTPFNQIPGTNWATVDMDLATLDKLRAGKSLNLKSDRKWSERYSLLGSSEALSHLRICAADLLAKGVTGIDPMARVETNYKMQFRTNPVSWIPATAYPRGTNTPEGTAGFTLSVGSDGRPKNCKIITSSGNGELDSATCNNLMKRAKFVPATNSYGYPIESEYSNRVRWVTPYDPTLNEEDPTTSPEDKSRPIQPIGDISEWAPNSALPGCFARDCYAIDGETAIRLTVGTDGMPIDCDITKASEMPEVDRSVCNNAMKRAKFVPATDRKGKLIKATFTTTSHWTWPPF